MPSNMYLKVVFPYRINKAMSDIYYGRVTHPWAIDIEEWKINVDQELKDYKFASLN